MSYQVLFNKSLPFLNGGDCAMSIAKLRFLRSTTGIQSFLSTMHVPSSIQCLSAAFLSVWWSIIHTKRIKSNRFYIAQYATTLTRFVLRFKKPTHPLYTHNISFELAGFLTVFPWSPTWYKYRCGCFRYSTSSSAVVEKPQKVNNK